MVLQPTSWFWILNRVSKDIDLLWIIHTILTSGQQIVRKCMEEPEDTRDYWYWSARILSPMVTNAVLI
jgi:hypothetical protein